MKKKYITHVALVIDSSGSMESIWPATLRMVREVVRTLVDINAAGGPGQYDLTVWQFSGYDSIDKVFTGPPTHFFPHVLTVPCGRTALYDAAVQAANDLALPAGPRDAQLIIVVTDGRENDSRMDLRSFQCAIRETALGGRRTFVFHVPPGYGTDFTVAAGVPLENINEWEATDAGTREVSQKTRTGLRSYSNLRAAGRTSTETFFSDASRITSIDLQDLEQVGYKMLPIEVKKEGNIKYITEKRTGQPYVVGQSFYQLMKTERVQTKKELLLRDKTTGTVYGGTKVRRLLGLSAADTIRVNPGNHANFDIFVQSRSVNRIIPRGTTVLVDVSRVVPLPPTWDHTQVLSSRQKNLLGILT
jgi:hypothetical protein